MLFRWQHFMTWYGRWRYQIKAEILNSPNRVVLSSHYVICLFFCFVFCLFVLLCFVFVCFLVLFVYLFVVCLFVFFYVGITRQLFCGKWNIFKSYNNGFIMIPFINDVSLRLYTCCGRPCKEWLYQYFAPQSKNALFAFHISYKLLTFTLKDSYRFSRQSMLFINWRQCLPYQTCDNVTLSHKTHCKLPECQNMF